MPTPRVALLVDLDNFSGNCSSRGIKVSPSLLKERARTAGNLVWSAVFIDSSTLSAHERSAWFASGFDICDCPKMLGKEDRARKDSVDPAIIEKLNAIADFLPVDEVLLASADRDYVRVVQRLRDAGKRVRIVAVESGETLSLALHADGILVYRNEGPETDPLYAAAGFLKGDRKPSDPETIKTFGQLAACVKALDKRWSINKSRFGFMRVVQLLQSSPEVRDAGLIADDSRRFLQFMIAQGMITKHHAAGSPSAGKKTDKNGLTYYQVNREHPFVWMTRKGVDLFAEEELLPEPAPQPAAMTAVHEAHPRVQRFRAREQKRDDLQRKAIETRLASTLSGEHKGDDP